MPALYRAAIRGSVQWPPVRRPLLTLLALAALTFTTGLGRQAITDADEAYYAEASREMIALDDWLTPHFNFTDRWQKPVLYYWMTAGLYTVAGISETTARLGAALAGLGLVLTTWWVARRLHTAPSAAWLAGAVVATSFGYLTMARSALPDLPLALCITATIGTALHAVDSRLMRWWLLAGAAAGCGFLMKGPVAIAVPIVVLLPIWWLERRLATPAWTGILAATAVSALVGLPWYLAMFATHGRPYLDSFFLTDNLERFTTTRFNEPRPLWFYPAVIAGGLLPWTLFAIGPLTAAAIDVVKKRLDLSREERRLCIWAAAPTLLFMASVGQQPRYVLPVLPPLAILLAASLDRRVREGAPALAPPAWATIALLLIQATAVLRLQPVLITAAPLAPAVAAAALVGAAVVLAVVTIARRWQSLPGAMAAAGVVVLLAVQFGALAGRRPEAVEVMARAVLNHRTAAERVGPYRVFVRNLIFYTRLRQEDLFDEAAATRFLLSPERILLIVRPRDLTALEQQTGVATRELARVTYLNTANLRLRSLLQPAADLLETVVLVTNR
jgi:4-amino-4-deoxy-L-arabinose transferase-like glycosyltransferase